MRGVILGVLTASLIFACACMNKPVQADTVPEVHPDPVMVPYTGMTVQEFQNVTEYRSEHSEPVLTNTLEAVGAFEPTYVAPEWEYYGECRITHYDAGPCCCGEWATGYTASGTLATINRTVATGEDLPFGTELLINGQVYVVEDRGVGPYEVDIFVEDHETAVAMGMYYTDVYIRRTQ